MIDKLIAFLSRFMAQPDKLLHFGGMALLCAACAHFFGAFPALWFGAGVAWGKERYDKAHPDKHSPDGWDAYATMLGGLFGTTLICVLLPLF